MISINQLAYAKVTQVHEYGIHVNLQPDLMLFQSIEAFLPLDEFSENAQKRQKLLQFHQNSQQDNNKNSTKFLVKVIRVDNNFIDVSRIISSEEKREYKKIQKMTKEMSFEHTTQESNNNTNIQELNNVNNNVNIDEHNIQEFVKDVHRRLEIEGMQLMTEEWMLLQIRSFKIEFNCHIYIILQYIIYFIVQDCQHVKQLQKRMKIWAPIITSFEYNIEQQEQMLQFFVHKEMNDIGQMCLLFNLYEEDIINDDLIENFQYQETQFDNNSNNLFYRSCFT